MFYVIGSGPAGVAAAWALVRQGIAVTMLDVGLAIEPERERLVDKMYAAGPEKWTPEVIDEMKGELIASATGIPLKRLYGSDFPHRDLGQGALTATGTGDVLTTGAKGGFSNVWGAQLMPYMARDMDGWCISPEEMAAHYRAVLEFVPISARVDDLAEHLPIYKDDPVCLHPSRQGEMLLRHLDGHREALRAAGIVHGASRVAVQVEPTSDNPRGCVYCGLCMHGCPYRLIYNSTYTLETLCRDPHFRYVPNTLVERLNETPDGVDIVARQLPGQTPITLRAERVYLGTGAVSTARILLESLEAYDQELLIRDSVQILMPLVLHHAAPGVMKESLHTLGQANALVFDKAISERAMHLQFYTYNDHFVATMKGMLKGLYPLAAPFLPGLFYSRLGVAFGYLHSDDSPAMAVRLLRDGDKSRMEVTARPSARTAPAAKALARKLWKNRGLTGVTPIMPQVKVMPPGKGYHFGASFPMREKPGPMESDRWGRPTGFRRVHVVDGSVLPSLASTTFTFTVMANAHRIAAAHKEFTDTMSETAEDTTPMSAVPIKGRCAVTGARGYMGSRITSYFQKHGWGVVAMSRGARTTETSLPFSLTEPIAPESLKGIDALIHCAWDLEARTHDEIWKTNVEGSKRLLQAAHDAGVRTIIFISTVSAYEGCESMYGQAKLEVETEAARLGAYNVRPGLTYGKGAGGMVGKLAGALKLPVVPLIGTGREMQPLTHEEDLCSLLQKLCEEHPAVEGRPITAASQVILSFRDILVEIASASGQKPRFVPIPWRLVWGLLSTMEKAGMRPNFRGDSVIGLVKANPSLDFRATNELNVPFRPFKPEFL